MSDSKLTYEISAKAKVDHKAIQAASLKAWADVRVPGSISNARATEAGVNIEALPQSLNAMLKIHPSGAPLIDVDFVVTAIGSGAAAKIGMDMWKYVLLPHIREKFGDKAIAVKKAAAKKTAAEQAAPAKAAAKAPAAKKATAKKTGV